MTDSAGDDEDRSTVGSALSAGLRSITQSGFEPAQEIPPDLRENHAGVPLPPLSNPSAAASRREPTAEGLAVADRILVAAGIVVQPAVASPSATAGAGIHDSAMTEVPVETTGTRTEHSGQTTLVPHSAIVTFPTGETCSMKEGETLTIGRVAAEGVVAVNHVEVSRRHVTLEMRFGQVIATDLGSTNGTMHVSGSRSTQLAAQSPVHLLEGDRLQVGADVPLCVIERIEWQA